MENTELIRVFFKENGSVVGVEAPAPDLQTVSSEELPSGAVSVQIFALPLEGVDLDVPLYNYRYDDEAGWALCDENSILAREHGDLETYRLEALRTLTARVNTRNERAAGIGLGRDALHDEKVQEALAYQQDSVIGPFITLEMNVKGKTAESVAARILEKRATEKAYKLQTEAVFLATKEALKAATTHVEISQVMAAIDWDQAPDG